MELIRKRYFCVSILLVLIPGREFYLIEKPQDSIRAVGQSVTFFCNSSLTDEIHWWFICDDCAGKAERILRITDLNRAIADLFVEGELGSGSPDGYRSSLTIRSVKRFHSGTYKCLDGTGSQGFGSLIVTSTPEVVCLTVSPRDQVAVAGDNVIMTASNPSSRLRYYFEGLISKSEGVEVYDGEELNDYVVDNRFRMMGVGDEGHADLFLRSVQPQDAGRYIVKDVKKAYFEVTADLVVFFRSPQCKQVWDVLYNVILLKCYANYVGHLTPHVTFMSQNVTAESLQKTASGGTIHFSRKISFNDVDGENQPVEFLIQFQLSRCGEAAGTWEWKYIVSTNDIDMWAEPIQLPPSQMSCREAIVGVTIPSMVVLLCITFGFLVYIRRLHLRYNINQKVTDAKYGLVNSLSLLMPTVNELRPLKGQG